MMATLEEGVARPSALGGSLMGNEPIDNGLILSLVMEKLVPSKTTQGRRKKLRKRGRETRETGEGEPLFKGRDWVACSLVCRKWSEVCEEFLWKKVCEREGFRKPRRPRGNGMTEQGEGVPPSYRQIVARNACKFCLGLESDACPLFGVRASGMIKNCALKFFVCRACLPEDRVKEALVKESLSVDLLSKDNRPMEPFGKKKSQTRRRRTNGG
jgi:hypothetical protein